MFSSAATAAAVRSDSCVREANSFCSELLAPRIPPPLPLPIPRLPPEALVILLAFILVVMVVVSVVLLLPILLLPLKNKFLLLLLLSKLLVSPTRMALILEEPPILSLGDRIVFEVASKFSLSLFPKFDEAPKAARVTGGDVREEGDWGAGSGSEREEVVEAARAMASLDGEIE